MIDVMRISIDAQITEVKRELDMRAKVYTKRGHGSGKEQYYLAAMEAVLKTLEQIKTGKLPSRSGVAGKFLPEERVVDRINDREGFIDARLRDGYYRVRWFDGTSGQIHQEGLALPEAEQGTNDGD